MSDHNEDRDKKLDELLQNVRSISALNEKLETLSNTVEDMKNKNIEVLHELSLVKTNQDTHTEKIEKIYEALYNPDDGLYQRVSTTINYNKFQEEDIQTLQNQTNQMGKEQIEISKKMEIIEEKQAALRSTLEQVAGKDLNHLRSAISTRKTLVRTIWIFATAIVAGIVKIFWEVFSRM